MKKLKQESKEEVPLNLDLPLDIVADILSRLSVKTLTRLKCVSSSCREFISDPFFVDIHRQQSMKNVKFLGTSYESDLDARTITVSFHLKSGCQIEKLPSCTLQELSSWDSIFYINLCPVTCDLVCFRKADDIYLCNPCTGELRVLPKPSSAGSICSYLGFGYSSQVREYKVVNMFRPRAAHQGMGCEVLTLSDHTKIGSSSWKRLTCPRGVHSETTSANGRIYWLINHRTPLHSLNTEELILSFDIANDTFSTLPRPPSWPLGSYKDKVSFMVMDEMLCITNKRNMQRNGVLDIWMLKENRFWTNIYSIYVLGFYYNWKTLHPECMVGGEIMFVDCHSAAFHRNRNNRRYSYNIKGRTLGTSMINMSADGCQSIDYDEEIEAREQGRGSFES